jgi:carbon storage regulator
MLVIRRRPGQSIRIGEDIEIHVTETGPSKVTLGIIAPKEVIVTRTELLLTRQQNIAAAEASSVETLTRLAIALRK